MHKCGVNGTNDHCLKDCKSFKSADSGEKIRMVMVSRACWNCLTPGHKAKYCSYPKNCSVKSCKMWHLELLHETHSSGKKIRSSRVVLSEILEPLPLSVSIVIDIDCDY